VVLQASHSADGKCLALEWLAPDAQVLSAYYRTIPPSFANLVRYRIPCHERYLLLNANPMRSSWNSFSKECIILLARFGAPVTQIPFGVFEFNQLTKLRSVIKLTLVLVDKINLARHHWYIAQPPYLPS
jgi:hypothetical protein